MIKEVELLGKKFEIDTTPLSAGGFKLLHAEISEVHESPASGMIAGFLREVGKEPMTRTLIVVSPETEHKVVLALGYKFSRSKAWRNLYNYHSMKNRQRRHAGDNGGRGRSAPEALLG